MPDFKLEFEGHFEVLFSNTLTGMMIYKVMVKNMGFGASQT
jgi:hypothetical protein